MESSDLLASGRWGVVKPLAGHEGVMYIELIRPGIYRLAIACLVCGKHDFDWPTSDPRLVRCQTCGERRRLTDKDWSDCEPEAGGVPTKPSPPDIVVIKEGSTKPIRGVV